MDTQSRQHNVLLILTDQQRYDSLGCYGAPVCRTPAVDGVAADGVCFSSAYTCAIACSPSRASLFTGVYPHRNGVTTNEVSLAEGIPNLASALQNAGYNLGYAGKWHVDHKKVPTQYGFRGKDFPDYGYPPADGLVEGLHFHEDRIRKGGSDYTHHYADYLERHGLEAPRVLSAHYGNRPGQSPDKHEIYGLQSGTIEHSFETMVAEDTIDLLTQFKSEREKDGKPFFLWANFWGPHTPCVVPEPYYSMYDPASVPYEPSFTENWLHKPERQKLSELTWGLSRGGWPGWQEIIARYWGYCTMIDDLIARVLSRLKELGLEKNTIVIFASDHGDMMGAHRLIEKGPHGYDESFRVPLVVRHPDCDRPGTVDDDFVYLHDLFPTILESANADVPAETDGISLREAVLGHDQATPRTSVYGYSGHGIARSSLRMVRTREYKMTFAPTGLGRTSDLIRDPWQLFEFYDLISDPYEMNNLYTLPGSTEQQKMLAVFREHMIELGDPMLEYFDEVCEAHAVRCRG